MERCPKCGGQLISCGCNYVQEVPAFRIPYLNIPSICGLCGEQWPDMFEVPDEEWEKFVLPNLQDKMLCRECFDELKKLWLNGWKNSGGQV